MSETINGRFGLYGAERSKCCHRKTLDSKGLKLFKIAIENANLCRKICDMHTFLRYAKMQQYVAIAYSRKNFQAQGTGCHSALDMYLQMSAV